MYSALAIVCVLGQLPGALTGTSTMGEEKDVTETHGAIREARRKIEAAVYVLDSALTTICPAINPVFGTCIPTNLDRVQRKAASTQFASAAQSARFAFERTEDALNIVPDVLPPTTRGQLMLAVPRLRAAAHGFSTLSAFLNGAGTAPASNWPTAVRSQVFMLRHMGGQYRVWEKP